MGELRDRIIRLRNEAEYLRGLLDVPARSATAVRGRAVGAHLCTADIEGGKPYVSDEEYEHRAEPNDSYDKPRLCC